MNRASRKTLLHRSRRCIARRIRGAQRVQRAPRFASGMTLVEVTVSIAMFSIVTLALASALTLASKALPDAKSANPSLLSAAKAHDQIASELFYAQSVTESTVNSITFTVADRNNDGTPETIRYAWTGVAGDPLTRQYNATAAVTVLNDCREFALTFDKRAVKSPATYTEQPEQQIYTSSKGVLGGSIDLNANNLGGQSLTTPAWSSSVAFWRVTRVRLVAQTSGPTGAENFRVQVRSQDANGLPGPVLYQQLTCLEASLPASFGNVEISFANVPAMIPTTEDTCIVLRHIQGASSGTIWTNNLSVALNANQRLLTTTNGGSSWSGNALRALAMTVYAAPSTKDADAYQYFLNDVRATIRSGTDPTGRVIGEFNIVAQPQVSGP